jgi:iron complex transport system ATP-binding protein
MLKVQGVEVRYNGFKALDGVNLEVEPGEILSIVGPNGAGKTTLLKVMDLMIRPKRGVVYVNGRELGAFSLKEIAKLIGYVPQRVGALTELSVFDFVLAGRRPYIRGLPGKSDFEKARGVLEDLKIQHLSERPLVSLSGGELQRVMIAKALVNDPKVLLLDEPTANLDPYFQTEILTLIRDLAKRRGISIVMVLHDLTQAYRFSDKVILLKEGKVFSAGLAEEVLTPENISQAYGIKVLVLKEIRAIVQVS